jgi:uncharacterized protein (TIGR02117 family)
MLATSTMGRETPLTGAGVLDARRECLVQLLGSLFVAGAFLLTAGCHGHVRELFPPPPGEATITIYVVGHGWHTGIVIRRDDIPAESWPEDRRFPTAGFLEVGWGDRAFYESPEAGMRLALKAAFNSEASVLHVAGFDPPPATYFSRGEIIAIELSSRGVQALARFVSAAYALDGAGQPIEVGPGLYPLSRFYLATGRYSLFYTCNTWVAEALRAAGCPITPALAVTAGNLLLQAEQCGRMLRPSAS